MEEVSFIFYSLIDFLIHFVTRAKRLTREMQAYWRHYDRVERAVRRQQEKELEEQQKIDVQLMEAKRQQRKLNFLITQTELYAHFMANKITTSSSGDADEEEDEKQKTEGEREGGDKSAQDILNQLDDNRATGRLAEIGDRY